VGQFEKSLEMYHKCLEIYRKVYNEGGEATSLMRIASAYGAVDENRKALDFYNQSLAIATRMNDFRRQASIQCAIAEILADSGKVEEALAYFRRGIDAYARIGGVTETPSEYGQREDGSPVSGEAPVQEAFAKEALYISYLARFHFLKSEYPESLERYSQLLAQSEKSGQVDQLFVAYTGMGKVQEALEDYEKAEHYYEKGMKLTEEMRAALLPSERTNFFEGRVLGFTRSEPSRGLTRVRMKLNRSHQSIDSSEATKARAFSDSIAQRSELGPSGIPSNVLETEDTLTAKVAALRKELEKTDKQQEPARHDSLSKEVHQSEADLRAFIDTLWDKYRPYAAVKYPRPVALRKAAIASDEHVVLFDVLGDGVGVKLVRGKEILETYYKRWKYEDVVRDVHRFRKPFEEYVTKDFDPQLAADLYGKLLSSVLREVPKGTPLTIIPDGILAILPFEALVVEGKAEWRKGPKGPYPDGITYLADVYPISYYQSVTALTLARTMGTQRKRADRMLVVADPVFRLQDERVQAASETKVAQAPGDQEITLMASMEEGGGARLTFSRLPETAVLAENLQRIGNQSCDSFTGLKASKNTFFNTIVPNLDQYRYVVFATHGVFSTKVPGLLEPFLALTMVPPGTDGFLKMSDVMGLKLNADVVALTACQTGLGKQLSGEGVMSMGRAFQYAGARSVLMSLWSVAEKSSVQLVEHFFRNLKEGKPKLDALKLAREEIRQAGYEHPFFWSSFILVGEVK
jgi:CHAT domain-containing protein